MPLEFRDSLAGLIDLEAAEMRFHKMGIERIRKEFASSCRLLTREDDPPCNSTVLCWDHDGASSLGESIDFEYYNIPLQLRQDYKRYWHELIIPINAIQEQAESEFKRLSGLGASIGIQYRTWNDCKERQTRDLKKDLYQLLYELGDLSIFLSSDSDVAEISSDLIKVRLKCQITSYRPSHLLTREQNDFAQLLVLSRFRVLALTRSSAYGEVAWWLNRDSSSIIKLMGKHGDSVRGFCSYDETRVIDIYASFAGVKIVTRYQSHDHLTSSKMLEDCLKTYYDETFDGLGIDVATGPLIYVDVGANIGLSSLFIARRNPQATCFCFEPHPELYSLLKAGKVLNKLGPNYLPIKIAVTSKSGKKVLHIPEGRHDNSSMEKQCFDLNTKTGTHVKVRSKTVSLDDFFIRKRGIAEIDLLKIDIQGHELAALSGGSQLIKNSAKNPRFRLVFEHDPGLLMASGHLPAEIWRLLTIEYGLEIVSRAGTRYNLDSFLSINSTLDLIGMPAQRFFL